MQVILLERVEKLGQIGDLVTVKPGYARNFLLPQNKALRATKANREIFESQRAQIEAENLKRRDEATTVAEKMANLSVVVIRQAGESGQLYGSVSARDVAEALSAEGFQVNRNQIRLNAVVKTLGLHQVQVALHPEVVASVIVNAARSTEEAEIQAESGQALVTRRDTPTFEREVGPIGEDDDLSGDALSAPAEATTENSIDQ